MVSVYFFVWCGNQYANNWKGKEATNDCSGKTPWSSTIQKEDEETDDLFFCEEEGGRNSKARQENEEREEEEVSAQFSETPSWTNERPAVGFAIGERAEME